MSTLAIDEVSRTFPGVRGGTPTQALLNTGQIIFGIILIGVIGLVSDLAFKEANRALFRWHAA